MKWSLDFVFKFDAKILNCPPASTPKTTKRQRRGWTSSGYVRFLDLRASRSAVPAYCPLCCRGAAWLVRGETMAVSMANWLPSQRGKPFAMTSIHRLSMRWKVGMLRSEIRVCVVTLAPASLQTRAAARSKGVPRLRSAPDLGLAARWSPRGSKARRHRQARAVTGRGRRSLRSKRTRKRWLW